MIIRKVTLGHMEAGKTKSGFELFKTIEQAVWIKLTLNKEITLKETKIYTHDKNIAPIEGYLCSDIKYLTPLLEKCHVFFIDECQFITEDKKATFFKMFKNKELYCFGLDMDYLGKPFSFMGELCCLAIEIQKIHGVCKMGKRMDFTFKMADDDARLSEDVGQYKPMCRDCFFSKNVKCTNDWV